MYHYIQIGEPPSQPRKNTFTPARKGHAPVITLSENEENMVPNNIGSLARYRIDVTGQQPALTEVKAGETLIVAKPFILAPATGLEFSCEKMHQNLLKLLQSTFAIAVLVVKDVRNVSRNKRT